MSVLINGMAMPINCWFCSVKSWDDDEYVCPFSGRTVKSGDANRHEDCPLIPIPDHGRLVDADDVIAESRCGNYWWETEQQVPAILDEIPTIIPAERSEK